MARHAMTPARRAALKKAQMISARKRRGKGKGKLASANRTLDRRRRRAGIAAGVIGATLVAGGAAYAGRSYVKKVASGGPKKMSTELVHVPGLGKNHTVVKRKARANPVPKNFGPKTVLKVSGAGLITKTTKGRMKYDTNRRRSYWQAKPVGGAPRKPYVSKVRGRR